MDKTAIRNFAIWARRKLIEDIKQQAYEIGVTEKEIKLPQVETSDTMIINDRTFNKIEIEQRKSLISKVIEKGFDNLIEEVAYTWFNRLIAIRFMEVNEYLPTGIRVLSSIEAGKSEPDIIKEALNIDLDIDRELVYKFQDANNAQGLFRYLFVKQCNALNRIFPIIFEEISDYTEMLLPSNLLSEGSIIRELVNSISEDDFKEQVEIIGWIYQYYISEKKDEVFEGLKKNIKITKENIPAATQLFTPDWVVKYMVENSLGKMWLERYPNEELKSKWKFYIEEERQEDVRKENKALKPEEIKVIDPAMGSGHILVYAFDVLYDIYISVGYSEKEIPKLILENNLYGLDIDDRSAQIAYFAIMMKARSKNRRMFRDEINLNICSIQESNGFPSEAVEFLVNSDETEIEKSVHKEDVEYLIDLFHDAKEYGSILNVKPIDFDCINNRLKEIELGESGDIVELLYKNIILEKVTILLKQAVIMSGKYDIVITNPPYMGNKGMNDKLKKYLSNHYPLSKSDLFAVFMELPNLKENGYLAMINQHSWMFLSSFEKLRKKVISSQTVLSMLHLGPRTFEEIGGEVVQSTAFVIKNTNMPLYEGCYIRLVDYRNTQEKSQHALQAIHNKYSSNKFISSKINFEKIPGCPIVYWASRNVLEVYRDNITLKNIAQPKNGLSTTDNNRFVRNWFEVSNNKIGFNFPNAQLAEESGLKWFPYNKGGEFRKWYGNIGYIVNWHKNGSEIKKAAEGASGGRIVSEEYYFHNSISWSKVSSGNFAVRRFYDGFIFDVAGTSIFADEKTMIYLLGLLNSKINIPFLQSLSPTMNFEAGQISNIPVIVDETKESIIRELVLENIKISKNDWDYYETSWDFETHHLLKQRKKSFTSEYENRNSIEFLCRKLENYNNSQFKQIKKNEEELNRLFLETYGLQEELSAEVNDDNITLSKKDKLRDIKTLISYSVGCMLGRFSVDVDGLVYAGGDFKEKWINEKDNCRVRVCNDNHKSNVIDLSINASFAPNQENILPITDDEYFYDDIVGRFVEFIKIVFGENYLDENLQFIADTLGIKGSETPKQAIRRYFLKDFYKDHVQTYQKKPIYWLFDSGKEDGFKALIYMHRYDEFTVAKVRTDYLHKIQKSYESELRRLNMEIDSNTSEREKANAKKRKEKILKQVEECLQYDQVIAHVANQRICINLDDGVNENYAKFQGVEIPQGAGKKPQKSDLLAKI
jgi:type II restriction/modification system DNA methylase subunit YeeA